MTELLAVLAGYVLGAMPFGYWLPLLLRGEDIRGHGSGNVGATNVFRVYGRRLGTAVALLDLAKGFGAALLGIWAGDALVGVLAGAAAMAGHARPVFLRFQKGGKMVATAGGVALAVAPLAMLVSAGVWVAVFVASRYASLASVAAAVALVAFTVLFGSPWPVLAFAALGAAAIVLLHRHNLGRLVRGTEHRFELLVRKTGIR